MGTTLRVLLVEDNEDDALLLLEELRGGGYDPVWKRVDTAAAMDAALEQESWNLILSDYSLPRFSGLAALALLREKDLDVPFLLVSGTVGESVAVAAMKAGAADFLRKDDLARLVPALEREMREARARQQRRRTEEALVRVQRRAEVVLAAAGEGIYGIDRGGRATFVNPAAARMLGYEIHEIVGQSVHGLVHHRAPGGSLHLAQECPIDAPLRNGAVHRVADEVFWRKDGTCFPVESMSTPIVEDEEVVGAVVTFHDVSAQRAAEETLHRALQSARESDRLKDAFLANMSHEIRTPLNTITGYAAVIAEELKEAADPWLREASENIQRAAQRLIGTIHQILDMARIESGTFEIRPSHFDPWPRIQVLVESVRASAEQKSLALLAVNDAGPATVRFDTYCLDQCLRVLLENAVKFTVAGEIRVRFARRGAREWQVEVSDTGVGIDPEYLPRLFSAFSQQDMTYTRRFEGTGLGLALARRYVERNGGQILAESTKGAGSTFTVVLPEAEPLAPAAVERRAPVLSIASSRRRPVALVVEDDEATQGLMRLVLRRRCEVRLAASAGEARQILEKRGDVALILMDLSLKGGEDGLQLTRSLRRDPRWKNVPIVATTAHALAEDRVRALDAGCDAYLAKPIDRSQLLELVESFLGAASGEKRPASFDPAGNAR